MSQLFQTIALILVGYVAADMFIELIGLIKIYREKKRKEEEQEHQWYVEQCENLADRLTAEYIRVENLSAEMTHIENLVARKTWWQDHEDMAADIRETRDEDSN